MGSLFIGNPHGVRRQNEGRHHNQRMSQPSGSTATIWPTSPTKATAASIECFTGSRAGNEQKVAGMRLETESAGAKNGAAAIPQCTFVGHRDIVGSVNMHPLAFGAKIAFPARITYQRAGPVRVSGSGMNNHARWIPAGPL